MLIINQDRDEIINLDNVTAIKLSIVGDGYTNEIYAKMIDETQTNLGVYAEANRAREIFNKLAEIQGGTSTFYMPKEWN